MDIKQLIESLNDGFKTSNLEMFDGADPHEMILIAALKIMEKIAPNNNIIINFDVDGAANFEKVEVYIRGIKKDES